jgi:hypothetical protein
MWIVDWNVMNYLSIRAIDEWKTIATWFFSIAGVRETDRSVNIINYHIFNVPRIFYIIMLFCLFWLEVRLFYETKLFMIIIICNNIMKFRWDLGYYVTRQMILERKCEILGAFFSFSSSSWRRRVGHWVNTQYIAWCVFDKSNFWIAFLNAIFYTNKDQFKSSTGISRF